MSTLIDPTANTSNGTSFLYQSLPPSSPIISNTTGTSSSQQQQQQSTDSPLNLKEERAKNDYNTSNEHLNVGYLVSPKPSTSRTSLTDDTSDNAIRRASIHAIKFENKKKLQAPTKQFKSNPVKKQKLKKAENDFQSLVDTYFQQLTAGCQQPHCKNKFCASGGIMNLQPQAALIMSIQLASKPNLRICIKEDQPYTLEAQPLPTGNKPFLQTLFSTSSFSGILKSWDQTKLPKKKTVVKNTTSVEKDQDFCTDFWKLLRHFNHTQEEEEVHYDDDDEDEEENIDYFEIDREATKLEEQGLTITPTPINLDVAIDFLHRALVIQVVPNEKINLWCQSVFQTWEGIGNSFLNNTTFGIRLEELKRFYQLVIHNQEKLKQHPIQIRIMTSITDCFEILLDRMLLNVDSIAENQPIIIEWCRSIICIFQWILCCKSKKQKEEQDGLAALVITKFEDLNHPYKKVTSIASTSQTILTQKLMHVTSKVAQRQNSTIRKLFQNAFASLDSIFLETIVSYIQEYLLNHFHTGSYKHGFEDISIMTLKTLQLIYQSNMRDPNNPVVLPTLFYSPEICKRLNIKNEYRVWKRVLKHGEGRHLMKDITQNQRKSRLFMTTASVISYPFMENDFQFSWFSYSFLLPPELKRKIVLMEAMSQMSLEYEDACVNHTLVVHAQKLLSEAPHMLKTLENNLRSATCPYLLLEIRRSHFIEDTMVQISKKWGDLKKPLKVKFVEGGEDGVDQGGVQKEFFGVLFEKLVSAETGLFLVDDQTRLSWIRPMDTFDVRTFEMVGVLMGLCIYNGVIMNLQFPKVLWKVFVLSNEALVDLMVAKKQLFTLRDLEEGWPTLANGLQQLLEYKGDDVEDVFCRDYEISMDIFGKGIVTVPLMEEPIVPVTNENRERYVQNYCTYFMYTAQREQILAIRRGIWSVIGSRALQLCTADELEMVACGLRQGPNAMHLDMTELEQVAEYDDGYSAEHPTIRHFWSIVHHDLTNEQKKQLLLFVTASDRIPVGGLKELVFYIQRNGPDSDRLPTALTCFSRLLLPEYATQQKLRDRLITAIENTKGFGLV